jgi:hypothetical protein
MTTSFTNDYANGFIASDGFMAPAMSLATATNTAAFTLTPAQIGVGAIYAQVNLTGTLAAAANVRFPTALDIINALTPDDGSIALVGATYRLRIANFSSANFAWTSITNTGLTLVGTQTIAQNACRDYQIKVTSQSTVTITSLGSNALTA